MEAAMTSPKNTSSDRRTTSTQQESSDLDAAITELHQTIIRLNNVIEQVKTMPTTATVGNAPKTTEVSTASALSMTADKSQNKPLTLLSLVIPKILH